MSNVPPPPPQNPYAQGSPQMDPASEKTWSTLVHLGGAIISFITYATLAFLPALIGYLVLKDRGPFVRENTKNALNFQLTLLIGVVIGWITSFILIGFLILLAVWVVNIVFSIIAAVRSNRGEVYRYPMTIAFIK
ncbi:DUF4870 domain-containing protein [Humibacter sp. RRB41]|uniref:DUF4870 domain-containing protein n=1 Tax=Humibacter sp. RRB41 TaxID=2919946 RepID=UPI001FAB1453|nr:DUF4870 domain-containing protein [Humibacter sp. RRB41]